ncbi:MAG: hypothetical protein WCW67_00035 [Candidatus Margulisiibacteriota bacterium]|jgi:hypothetical protein
MKKSLLFSLVILLLSGLIVPVFAADTDKIAAIKKELTRLNKSYGKAKSAWQKKQIADKMLAYKARLKILQAPPPTPVEITPAPAVSAETFRSWVSVAPSPETIPVRLAPAPPPHQKRLIMPQFGWVASTIYIGGEYLFFPTPNFNLMMNVGYGYGGDYSLTALGIGALFNTGADTFVETTVAMANYSKRVGNVPGIQGAVEGTATGIGLYGGENIGDWQVKVGFSTAMGIGITTGYRF